MDLNGQRRVYHLRVNAQSLPLRLCEADATPSRLHLVRELAAVEPGREKEGGIHI